jgi:transcriptional regulator with XRE-family HTH domain
MPDLTLVVAENLKKIREEKKLSLDRMSELTGVSKSMLGQIERAESSPTITTIWKIANGLKIPFTTLLSTPQKNLVLNRRTEVTPLIEDKGRYRVYPYFPSENGRSFETYEVEIEKGGHLTAEPHQENTQEFLIIFQGELTLTVDEDEILLHEGDSIRFRADKPHSYHNQGNCITKLAMTIQYA